MQRARFTYTTIQLIWRKSENMNSTEVKAFGAKTNTADLEQQTMLKSIFYIAVFAIVTFIPLEMIGVVLNIQLYQVMKLLDE